MKPGELVNQVEIDQRKLTEYALNPDHPKGRHKARVFKVVLGYTRENHQALLEQLEATALDAEVMIRGSDEHGQRVQVDLTVSGTMGQEAIVRTGWVIASNSTRARLVSLYVKEK